MAFCARRGAEISAHWARIPPTTQVLLTHGPPLGHGDFTFRGQYAGCYDLLRHVTLRVRPQFHVFGHIHEGYGRTEAAGVQYLNASVCTFRYAPTNPPLVIDLEV
jgi:Icc-related predicted phosphoesterase